MSEKAAVADDDTTPSPQAAEAGAAAAADDDAGDEEDYSSKSISQLKAIAAEKNVDLTGCLEKRDMIELIEVASASAPAAAAASAAPAVAAGPNAHAFNFDLGAAAAASDSDDDGDDDDDDDDQQQDMMQILPPCMVRRVERLRELNTQREAIVEQYQAERAALERKFAEQYEPLFEERADVVAGKFDEEIDAKADKAQTDEEDGEQYEEIVGIPQFWVCAMGHMEAVAELITERDVDCLEALTDVRCIDDEDGGGFSLEFHFRDNEYFSNKVLRKKYTIPNLMLDDEPILKNVEGCKIEWKDGMCLTHREIKKKQRAKSGKNAGQIRTIIKKEKADSFFHFFSPPKIPTMDEMDEDEADAIEQAFDLDYDVAQAFRSHIVPKAALWFSGEALDEGFDIPEGEWPGGEDEGGVVVAAAAAAAAADGATSVATASSPFPPPADGEENPECKQN